MKKPSMISLEALKRQDPAEVAGLLDEACGDNDVLRERVEQLIEHTKQVGSFLEHLRWSDAGRTMDRRSAPQVEQHRHLHRPLQAASRRSVKVGWASFYMAVQKKPVRRKVALKIIKPGMDSQQVIARFEAERQALALMDHPNIAQVIRRRHHGIGSTLLRDGTGEGNSDHRVLRSLSTDDSRTAWIVCAMCAVPSSTPTRKASSTGT